MSRILIIEDEKDMAAGLRDNLELEGHDVIIAEDGVNGLRLAIEKQPHLIILDIMLPGQSGFDVCKELRARDLDTPIIMLTARGEEIDKVLGLELGADDYVTKPFSLRELLARVKAVLRRYQSEEPAEKFRQFGTVFIDFERYIARDERGEIEMTHKEFELLKYFFAHKEQTVSRDDLITKVWGYDAYPTSRTVDNFILKLRKKIEPNPARPVHILTVHGIGYKFIP